MKEMLMAPLSRPSQSSHTGGQSSGGTDIENKYKDVMGFATPNIRPCKRMKGMNQTQIKSHLNLQRMVGSVMAGGRSNDNEERDSNNFKKVTAKDFFKRTREAEIELKSMNHHPML